MRYIAYHEIGPGRPCPDGAAAAFVARRALGTKDLKLVGLARGFPYSIKPKAGDFIYVLDFWVEPKVVNKWVEAGAKVTIIDHHDLLGSDLSALSDRVTANINTSESAATLTWKYFYPREPVPAILLYIKDKDLGDFKLPYSEEVNHAINLARLNIQLRNIGTPFAMFEALLKLSMADLQAVFAASGAFLLDSRKDSVAEVADRFTIQAMVVPGIGSYTVPVIRLDRSGDENRLVSAVCSRLYRAMPEYPFVACITSGKKVCLRSDKDAMEVVEIARVFGGGGQPHAAAFVMPQQQIFFDVEGDRVA